MKFSKIYALLMASAMVLGGCDQVDENDRLIELPAVESQRVVLLEEFTGQRCINCPAAHEVVKGLKELYGEQLISVSIHAGSLAVAEGSMPNMVGLMQPGSDEYANKWGITTYPSGVVNRRSGKLSETEFPSVVREELKRSTPLSLQVDAKVENGQLICHVDMMSSKSINGKLQLWVTESHIIAMQMDKTLGLIKDYEHNHVYRACIKDTEDQGFWGEDVAIKENIAMSFDRQIAVKDNWNPENLSVVAFVYNDKDGVYQAAECKVVLPSAE